MSDVLSRLLVVVAVVALAAGAAWIIGRVRRPPHPGIVVGEEGSRPGVVVFTSTTCATCKETIARLEQMRIPFREITSELEPQRFEDWGVVAVPVTVVIDAQGRAVDVFTGVPRTRSVSRSLSRAGMRTS
jgi:thioredoxin-like negative regulator of GroEL